MNKLIHLGKTLNREQQKKILAGNGKVGELDPGGGGGGCVGCQCMHGGGGSTYHSCWYTTGSPEALCDRVYPSGCTAIAISPGCTSGDTCITN